MGLADELAELGGRRRLAAGDALFHEGDRPGEVHVLLAGRLKVTSLTDDGREVVLAVREPGDLLGELSALDGVRRSATATALEPCEVAVLPRGLFLEHLATRPGAALALLAEVTARLRDADRKRVEFGGQASAARVARRLVELAERFGRADGDAVRIELPLTQEDLAGWAGASREAAGRALRALREQGLVETGRQRIVVLDLPALRAAADA